MKFPVTFFISIWISSLIGQNNSKPNILWITCEDISPYLGAYGYDIQTPNIDRLAKEGVRYKKAYTTAGVCAPSRSAMITGMYQTSIGTQHMRTIGDPRFQPVPSYSAVIPDYVKCFPEYLRKAGYFCTNNEKQDYQFIAPVTVWDENGPAASFRHRPDHKPFFSVFNFGITHESQLFSRTDSLLIDPEHVTVPPIYPDTKTVRHDIARLLTNIENMDRQVGELLNMLVQDGLYDHTIIFFFSDHGGALPWMKREILERGTHIPFIIRYPHAEHAGETNNDLVSAVDFAPSALSLAGVSIPKHMQGQSFLGSQKSVKPRKYVFAARDRMDTEYDRVRMVRDQEYRYIFNYMPDKPNYQNIEYRLGIPMMKDILFMRDHQKLDSNQMHWFRTKPVEELYNVDQDPYELNNLASNPRYQSKLNELRTVFKQWTLQYGDLGSMTEKAMIRKMWNGTDAPPITADAMIDHLSNGLKLTCTTKGASIGYRIKSTYEKPVTQTVQSWDMGFAFGRKNGINQTISPSWNVYQGENIQLNKGDTLIVKSMRIGYTESIVKYIDGKTIIPER